MAESRSEDNTTGDHAQAPGTSVSYTGGGPSVSDEDRTTALRAAGHFEAGEYDKCLSTLGTIAAARPKDHKLVHNRAVVEFHRTGQKKIEVFKRALRDIYNKVNILCERLNKILLRQL